MACAPSGHTVPEVLADSKLAALVRVIEKPLEVLADSAWLGRQLPDEEIQFAREARIDLLVPVAVSSGRREALLVLGIKRSEEPYTREDQELLDAIASGSPSFWKCRGQRPRRRNRLESARTVACATKQVPQRALQKARL